MSIIEESNLELSRRVFNHVAGSNDAAAALQGILEKSIGEPLIPKAAIEEIITLLCENSKLVVALFEENQYILERVAAAMRKNHTH